jgi:predicted neutral ceramidase superfamily lipid hydrolase
MFIDPGDMAKRLEDAMKLFNFESAHRPSGLRDNIKAMKEVQKIIAELKSLVDDGR